MAFVLLIGGYQCRSFESTGILSVMQPLALEKWGCWWIDWGFSWLIAILWVRKVFNDPMIESRWFWFATYAVFFICEHFFHVSGVLGLVALGIVMAGIGRTRISLIELYIFWELIAFVANVIIFIVVGVVIAQNANPTGMDFLILACLCWNSSSAGN